MNNLRLIKVNFAGAEVLTREQLKQIGGGGPQCGSYPNCTTDPCRATSGPCMGKTGTCGRTSATQSCTCGVIC